MTDLSWVHGLIIDMDGVLWRGRTLLDGVPELFGYMREHNLKFTLATNNATATPEAFAERLRSGRVEVSTEHIVTSALATSSYLAGHYPNSANLLVIGDTGLRSALTDRGFTIVESAEQAEAVVVGMDPTVNWHRLAEATLAIRAGAFFVGTNPDPSFPNERGQVPGNGAILAALEAASGQKPLVIGKPEPHLYRQAIERMGTDPEQTLVLGDRLETDIQGGIRLGSPTALLMTGVTDHATAKASEIKPTYIFEDLPELLQSLKGAG